MLIHNGKTILTAKIERSFVEIGGTNPKQTFSDKQLGNALAKSVEVIADAGRYDILERIYETARLFNPNLPCIDDIEIPD
jgi:hypothetical protein